MVSCVSGAEVVARTDAKSWDKRTQSGTSGREKEGQLNQGQRRQKDTNGQRKGTSAENSSACRKENGGEEKTFKLAELLYLIVQIEQN